MPLLPPAITVVESIGYTDMTGAWRNVATGDVENSPWGRAEMGAAIDVPCTHTHGDGTKCNAQPGEPCHNRFGDRDPNFFHFERINDAANGIMNADRAQMVEIPKEDIDAVVDGLGID